MKPDIEYIALHRVQRGTINRRIIVSPIEDAMKDMEVQRGDTLHKVPSSAVWSHDSTVLIDIINKQIADGDFVEIA